MKVLPVFFAVILYSGASLSDELEFNTDLLNVTDKKSVSSGVFNKVGYIVPGSYTMKLVVNGLSLGDMQIDFYNMTGDDSSPCLTSNLIRNFGLKSSILNTLLKSKPIYTQKGVSCYDPKLIDGLSVRGELNKDSLNVSIPNTYLDYVNDYWENPSRWDDGLPGVLLDYNINLQGSWSRGGLRGYDTTAYGVLGANYNAWRLRMDWQGNYSRVKDNEMIGNGEFDIRSVYGYRALPELNAKLIFGEQYIGSSLFDGFQFAGISMQTDDAMLPPNLRGYAPEVVGIARTNAKVIISQNGNIINETIVASGPFRIQDLSSDIKGTLDVKVEEQDGTVQKFEVNTSSIPYLSRPGSIRYKFYSGKGQAMRHEFNGPLFLGTEFSWGINNGFSLLGGAILSDGYDALAVGVGRDLMKFGAISFDITQSMAKLPEGNKSGKSYRINYSKVFEEYNSQVTFAGYRFSEHDFMNMKDYISTKSNGSALSTFDGFYKEMYTVLLSKQFREFELGAFLNYTHQTYWQSNKSDDLSLTLSHNLDIFEWKNVTANLSAYQRSQGEYTDSGVFFGLSMPLDFNRHLSYNASSINDRLTNSVSYYDHIDARNNYAMTASVSDDYRSLSGFYNHAGDKATLIASANHQSDGSNRAGLSISGGITATPEGVAMHRVSMMGGARLMVDTDGASDIPVSEGSTDSLSNASGKAVIADISSYRRQSTNIDLDNLNENVDPVGASVISKTVTEGAIGYIHFDMLSGRKGMVELFRKDGNPLPFAAEVFNAGGIQLGMVGEDGMAYLAGLREGLVMQVRWGEGDHCDVSLPSPLPSLEANLRLVCI